MGKYEPLKEFLAAQQKDRVPMTFAEIEEVLGDKLPASKFNRAWWSNNPDNNVMTKEWLAAGYKAEAVDLAAQRLVFVRGKPREDIDLTEEFVAPRHPAFGCMKGTLTVAPGVDLTESLFPNWEEYERTKYGPGSKLHDE